MKRSGLVLMGLLMAFGVCGSAAADWPARQVTLIVPQAPGGASDALGRILASKLSSKWNQPVVVDNRAGAGGNIGLDLVAKSPPDGYTLLMSYEGTQAINGSVYSHLSYDPVKDFTPVSAVAAVPFLCVVNKNVKASTFKEFVALAQSHPGMTFGSAGNGSVNHLLGEMVNLAANTQLVHVPYKGASAALTDLLGERIDAVFTSYPSIAQQVEVGSVKALASTSAARVKQMPSLPTIAEAGYPDFDVDPWFGVFAPKNTPDDIVQKINADIAVVMRDPDTVKALLQQGATPLVTTPQALGQMLDRDIKKWAIVVERSGAQVN